MSFVLTSSVQKKIAIKFSAFSLSVLVHFVSDLSTQNIPSLSLFGLSVVFPLSLSQPIFPHPHPPPQLTSIPIPLSPQQNSTTDGRFRALLSFGEDLIALMQVSDINATKDVMVSVPATDVSNRTLIELFSRSSTILSFTNSCTHMLKSMAAICTVAPD